MKQISVVICSHNPRPAYLRETLNALKAQTLAKEQWELLLIDNASKQPLVQDWDLAWHTGGRHIREEELGLTPARLRGIDEAKAEIVVFVDDDVVLAPDFLEHAIEIADKYRFIGAWSGQCIPSFEVEPPAWAAEFLGYLTIRTIPQVLWSNLGLDSFETIPWGAGLCIRLGIAAAYRKRIGSDTTLRALDRRGTELLSCGDIDLGITACDLGLGTGVFPQLKLTHLIPANRVQEEYFLRVIEGTAYSMAVLRARRGIEPGCFPIKWYRRPLGHLRRWLAMTPRNRRIAEARLRGQRRALKEIAGWRDINGA